MSSTWVAAAITSAMVVSIGSCLGRVSLRRAARGVLGRLPQQRRGLLEGSATGDMWWDRAPEQFERLAVAADLGVSPVRMWRRWLVGTALAGGLFLAAFGPGAAACAVAASAAAPAVLGRLAGARQDRRAQAQMPAFLDSVSSLVRAGCSLHAAVLDSIDAARNPLAASLGVVANGVRAGSSLAVELDRWSQSASPPIAGMVTAALTLGLRDGGPQVETIEGVAATIRDRLDVSNEIRALSSQARASACVIIAAPAVFAVLSSLVDPSVLRFLVGTPFGLGCAALGLALEAAGAAWMARIARSAR